jgi:hypothetical protein
MAEYPLRVEKNKYAWMEWRDVLPSGDQQIVVQAWRRRWLGFSQQVARGGFIAAMNGERRDLSPDEWDVFD